MRLTLRTLLAYMDDVLDPADKEELGKKIESSEFAEDLMHRTRDTMRRLRLSAPQVLGTGMGLDPNTVAEYLDNALPPESVGDFERICLESDMHLAEVASCHHVLTMVLGQPADIDPAAKQRMYTIPAEAAERKRLRVEAAHRAVVGSGQPASVGPSGAAAGEARVATKAVELPEYLRASGWQRYRGLIIGLAAMLLVGASLYLIFGTGKHSGQESPAVAQAGAGKSAGAGASPPAVAATVPVETAPAAATGTDQANGSADGPAIGARTPAGEEPGNREPGVLSLPSADHLPLPGATDVARSAPSPAGTSERYPAADGAATASAVGPAGGEAAPALEAPPYVMNPPQTARLEASRVTSLVDATADGTAPSEPALDTAPDEPLRVADAGARETLAGVPTGVDLSAEPQVVELGTYRGGKTVLLRHDESTGHWLRVAPRSAVLKGERLLALPEFRPMVTLATGVHMDLLGGSQVTVDWSVGASAGAVDGVARGGAGSPAEAGAPRIDVVYGRVVLVNTSNQERAVELTLGPASSRARLAQNATLAIEVERQYVAGSDPRKTPAPVMARIYVPDGGVVWEDEAGARTIDRAAQWRIENGEATAIEVGVTLPAWIDQESELLSSEQRYGAPEIERNLVPDRPADVQLLELFQGDGRREVKSLVTRSGIHVGLFVPFIEALRDSAQRPNWTAQINSLRAAMALGPESAERIWQTLVQQRGERAAAELYEMLCGYNAEQVGRTPEQMKTGAVARLIDWLDEDSLDYRVLAVHDLREITGKELMPNPAASAQERARNIRTWRSRLNDGDLTSRLSE